MCGHVGIAGKLEFKDEDTMKRLLLLDYFRGKDSTGLAAIRSTGETYMAKCASHPLDLFELAKFKTALNASPSMAFIGHNRAATRGGISAFNAHPYQFDGIIGAHNGTLDSDSTKALEEAVGEKFPVDSMAIFAGIARLGIADTIGLMHEGKDTHSGAWSLVWYDEKDRSLNFLRNQWRPMYLCYNSKFDRLFWGSEWQMIDAALSMSTIEYEMYRDEKSGYQYFATQENIHYKFDLEELKLGGTKIPKPVIKELKGKEPVAAASRPFGIVSGGTQTTSTTTSHGNRGEATVTHLHLIGGIEDPYAGVLTKEEFEDIAKYGCSWCSRDINWGDTGITMYERDDILLCADCSGNSAAASPTRIHMADLDKVL